MTAEHETGEDGLAADDALQSDALPAWFSWVQSSPVGRPPSSVVTRRCELVCDSLQALIRSDGLRAGDALPSERALSLAYNVARGSIRAALLELREQGLLRIAHGQATRVQGRLPAWALSADGELTPAHDLRRWRAALRQAHSAVAAATFEVDKVAAHRPMFESVIAALQLLETDPAVSSAVLAIDICHRRILELSPPALRAALHEALHGMPAQALRDALDGGGLCAGRLHRALWVLQANWIDRNCDGTKSAVLDYLTLLETLCTHRLSEEP